MCDRRHSRACTPSAPGDIPRQRRVDESSPARSRRAQKKGRVPLEQAKPAPSEYPHATALGKFAAPRQNPHVLPPGLGSTHPKGGSIGLFGYKRGGCAKEMKRAELALNEERRHRVVCFHCYKSPEQEAKSQQIVGQSLLSCLQYPVPYLSRLQRIYPSQHSKLRWSMMLGRSLS